MVAAKVFIAIALLASVAVATRRRSEIKIMPGHTKRSVITSPLPRFRIEDMPQEFDWGNINGQSLITKSLNQHLPQYCGSCWAHGAVSALSDRIKIARKGAGEDINLAIQYVLNCGGNVAGSCNGGSASGTYQFIHESPVGIPFDTCLQYEACSSDSGEAGCQGRDYSCSAINTCRTCNTFTADGGKCVGLNHFPNATIGDYGDVSGEADMMSEIFARGPIACGIDAQPIIDYNGGIYNDPSDQGIDHIVSITGWGFDKATNTSYWNIRNSWGQYWGEKGYIRLVKGQNQLSIESDCSWAVPGVFTEINYPCYEDGSNCLASARK